jgi:hypothetical protein
MVVNGADDLNLLQRGLKELDPAQNQFGTLTNIIPTNPNRSILVTTRDKGVAVSLGTWTTTDCIKLPEFTHTEAVDLFHKTLKIKDDEKQSVEDLVRCLHYFP